jgi:hypothetical protein
MGVTININGLSLVHAGSGGVSTATLPNVCLTPPTGQPVPYASVALSQHLVGGTRSLRVDGDLPAATAGSVFARSTGDEAGSQGGVLSGTHGAEASFLTASPNVRLEGRAACRLTDKMLHNHSNTVNAAGLRQQAVRARASAAKANEVKELRVAVLDANSGQPVHAPCKVVLRGKGVRRSSTRLVDGHIVFRDVEKQYYRVIAVHDCYPEGQATVTVATDKQVVPIFLKREKLRDIDLKGVRLGVNVTGDPSRALAVVNHEFHDVILPAFFSSLQDQKKGPLPDWAMHKAMNFGANAPNALMELTPFFWAAPVMDRPHSKKELARAKIKPDELRKRHWHPNPSWVNKVKTPAAALQEVKEFIDKVVAAVKGAGLEPKITRVVVINEPMNMITRAITQKLPKKPKWYHWPDPYHFCKLLLPVQRDKNYARGNKKGVKHYRFRKAAYDNLAAILEHAHMRLPDADLIVNDYGVEGHDGKKGVLGMRGYRFFVLIRELLARLGPTAKQKLRVGFQAHMRSGGQLENSGAGREPLDFRPSSIRRQVEEFRRLGEKHGVPLKICITEFDLELPPAPAKGKDIALYPEHRAAAERGKTVPLRDANGKVIKKKGKTVRRPREPTDPPWEPGFFNKRAQLYTRAFRKQRDLQRAAIAAMLRSGNVQSFEWWDIEDGLIPQAGGSNFRYHGYLFHRHVVCPHCKAAPDMQVPAGDVVLYRKPSYWATVAAFRDPVGASNV